MILLFFSGGIDSATLAYDVVQHPYRYGVDDVDQPIHLLTYSVGTSLQRKRRALAPLMTGLRKVSKFKAVEHKIVPCPLIDRLRRKTKSWQTISPLAADFNRDSMPYAPGLHLFLASCAINTLELADPSGYHQALFGFQFDGPEWHAYDTDEMLANDTTPQFVESLNELAHASGGADVTFKAPFLDQRMTKDMIVAMGVEVGVPFEHTSSCVEGWKVDCGICPQCMRRFAVMKGVLT